MQLVYEVSVLPQLARLLAFIVEARQDALKLPVVSARASWQHQGSIAQDLELELRVASLDLDLDLE